MSGTPFQIPGLGQAISTENVTPDLLAAAVAIGAVDGHGLGAIENGAQVKSSHHEVLDVPNPAQITVNNEVTAQDGTATETQSATDTQPAAADAMEVDQPTHIDGSLQDGQSAEINRQSSAEGTKQTEDTNLATGSAAPPSPHVAHALEAALGGPIETTTAEPTQTAPVTTTTEGAEPTAVENVIQEWEVDSSPYESSSDESSSSDDDSDEEDGGYQLLGIEETARMLMSETDNDGASKDKGGDGFRLRTKNEVVEEVLPKPDVIITPETRMESLGVIQWVVEKTAVIKSNTAGEVQVLDIGTALCLADRTIIGALAETIGNVRSPLYTVNFATEDEIKDLKLEAGTEIFYPVDHAKYVFTQTLKQEKGTDASNLHDEELGPDEMEFSDDEKEAEYKRQQKLKKRGNKAGRGGRDQASHPHPLGHSNVPGAPAGSVLNYDEDEDGPYKPLPRPAGFGQGLPPSLPALPPKPEGGFSQPSGGHGTGYGHMGGGHRGGRGDFRGGRGGGRGGRGNHGRGGRGDHRQYNDRRHGGPGNHGGYDGHASATSASPASSYQAPQTQQQPPQPPQNPHLPPPPYGANPPAIPTPQAARWPAAPAGYVPPAPPIAWSQGQTAQHQSQHQPPAAPQFNFNYQTWAQSQHNAYGYGQQPQAAAQQPAAPAYSPAQAGQPSAYAPAPTWAGVPPPPPPTGAYVNPAFFGALQRQQPEMRQGQIPPAPSQPNQQHQQQHQQYWAQQAHGGFGQGK